MPSDHKSSLCDIVIEAMGKRPDLWNKFGHNLGRKRQIIVNN